MGAENDDGSVSRSAIPLIAGAIVLAQGTMSIATVAGGTLTGMGVGRKTLFMVGLLTLPFRCAMVILCKDSGDAFLLSTQFFDGLGGGFFGLLHPMIVADITFGTGRFNVVSKYSIAPLMHNPLWIDSQAFNAPCTYIHPPFVSLFLSGIDGILLWSRSHPVQLVGPDDC
jgi:hypothetical protein